MFDEDSFDVLYSQYILQILASQSLELMPSSQILRPMRLIRRPRAVQQTEIQQSSNEMQ